MSELSSFDHEEVIRRISRDLVDGYDEELEMEIEDHHPLPADRLLGLLLPLGIRALDAPLSTAQRCSYLRRFEAV